MEYFFSAICLFFCHIFLSSRKPFLREPSCDGTLILDRIYYCINLYNDMYVLILVCTVLVLPPLYTISNLVARFTTFMAHSFELAYISVSLSI